MKKHAVMILFTILLSFSGVKQVSAGEIVYSDVKDNRINTFAELPGGEITKEKLLIDEKNTEVVLFSDSPSINTVFLTDRSAVTKDIHDDYCKMIRSILEAYEENDRYCFISFADEIIKDADFTGKQLDILNAAEKLEYSESSMQLTNPVCYSENLFDNSGESFCRIILFTKTDRLKSIELSEKYKYPLYTVLLDESSDEPDTSGFENSGFMFRYFRCTGKTDPESIAELIKKSSRVCRVNAIIPDEFLRFDSDRNVVLELKTADSDYSFSKDVRLLAYDGMNNNDDDESIKIIIALSGIILIVAGASAAVVFSFKKRKNNTGSDTVYAAGTAFIHLKKGRGTLVSETGTKMLFENPGEYRIVLSGRGDNNRNIVLVSSRETVIGRNQYQSDEIIYDERSVSQKHCRIYTRENRVFVEDLNSLNHTFVDGVEIKDEAELTTGSVLKIGRLEFDVRIIYGR